MNPPQVERLQLPEILSEIAEEVGLVNALALLSVYRGVDFYVPLVFGEEHLVVQVFGRQMADQLSGRFGGCRIPMGKVDSLPREQRDRLILEERPKTTISKLAQDYGLCQRTIWKILSRHRRRENDPNQLTLNF